MNFLADEGVERQIVDRLRAAGHDVDYTAESSPASSDDEVLHHANERGALPLTSDKDFGELVFRQRRIHAGVVLLRLAGLSIDSKIEHIMTVVQTRAVELSMAFAVISPGLVRIRHHE